MQESRRLELSRHVLALADAAGLTIGTAESCTGGLVCAALTDIPGSSSVVRGGVVSYAIGVKNDVLNVSPEITDDPKVGVVSKECAIRMCEGAREVLKCDIAVSITGIAGPGGAEPGKPVGTVWFGITHPDGTRAECCHFVGDRDAVRAAACIHALELLEEILNKILK